jgi:hypothetical protein
MALFQSEGLQALSSGRANFQFEFEGRKATLYSNKVKGQSTK